MARKSKGARPTGRQTAAARHGSPAAREATARVVGAAVAFVCVLVMYLATWRGFFYYSTVVQLAAVSSVIAGLLAKRWQDAAGAAAAALVTGWLLMPPVSLTGAAQTRADVLNMAMFAAGGALVAAIVQILATRYGRIGAVWAVSLTMVLLVANVWATSLTVGYTVPTSTTTADAPPVTLVKWLESSPVPKTPWIDDQAYVEYYHRLKAGANYYDVVRSTWIDNAKWGVAPGTVFEVRPPAVFFLWRAIAPQPVGILIGWLALASAAAMSAAVMTSLFVRPAFAILTTAVVSAYLLYFSTTTTIIYAETWGGAFALVAVSWLAISAQRESWKTPFLVGVIAAVASASIREMCLFVPLAGALSTLWAVAERKRFQWVAWAGAWLAIVAYYAIHDLNAARILRGGGGLGLEHWLRPSLGNLVDGLTYGSGMVGGATWLPYVLAVAGLVGVAAAPTWQARSLLACAVVVPLAFLLFFRNDAVSEFGESLNYWGVIVTPIVYACAAHVFAFVPGMRESVAVNGARSPGARPAFL